MVGLSNVDNTTDASKPISTATQSALNLKANSSDVYTKTQVDTSLGLKANSSDVYTKTQVDTPLGLKANSSNVYTKCESRAMDRVLTAVLVVVLSSVLPPVCTRRHARLTLHTLRVRSCSTWSLSLDVCVTCVYLAPRSTSAIVSVHLEARVQLQ